MQAAEMNQCEVAECLLDYGVDPFATECNGRTAVHFAAREVGPSDRVFELRLIFTGKAGGVAVGQGYIRLHKVQGCTNWCGPTCHCV